MRGQWVLALFVVLAGCLAPEPADTKDLNRSQDCPDPCERILDTADAFEPAVAVHEDQVLVAHTPFVDGARTLHVLRSGQDWQVEVPFPDIGAVFEGCDLIFDAGAGFLADGTPVVTAIAGDDSGLDRVLFAYLPETGDVTPISPDSLACVPGQIPDFARLAPTADGLVVTWRHLTGDPTDPTGIAWSRNDGSGWTAPTTLVRVGDPLCVRGHIGPTPAVVDGALVVASQNWEPTVRNCVTISEDWTLGVTTDLGPSPITWPTPLAVGDDTWVVGATLQGDREVPTVWRASSEWTSEPLPALASDGATTVAAAVRGDTLMLTSFRLSDGDWEYLATLWDGAWHDPVRLDNTSIQGHNMGISGMGHYMGLAPEADGFRAAWVAGQQGARVLAATHIPETP